VSEFIKSASNGTVFTLHNETPYDGSQPDPPIPLTNPEHPLNGMLLSNGNFNAVWVWFETLEGYDGTVNFETSPDGEVWFPIEGFEMGDQATINASVTPSDGTSYVIPVLRNTYFRARLSGGTEGAISAYAFFTHTSVTGG